MNDIDFRLLNDFQRGFPLVTRPYAALADLLGIDEIDVIARLDQLGHSGAVSRIGAVLTPRRAGASTLAALAAPAQDMERIAALVSASPAVNHNYEREDALNLWFVASAADPTSLDAQLDDIARATGCPILRMPLIEEFHIDLGFDLSGQREKKSTTKAAGAGVAPPLDAPGKRLLQALQDGLDLVPRPYSRLAMRAGLDEAEVLRRLGEWLGSGFIKRFGVVVRHRELGYTANAMCVWDVPDDQVSALGRRAASEAAVTLCYRRARALPGWPYNLYCMIHGHSRDEVLAQLTELTARCGLDAFPWRVLFSLRRFKQCGARYVHDRLVSAHG